jgi:capsule polysaccharide export protein KpsE/RkpR
VSEIEKKILETFEKIIPKLNERQQDRLLAFGEGMAFKVEEQEKKTA